LGTNPSNEAFGRKFTKTGLRERASSFAKFKTDRHFVAERFTGSSSTQKNLFRELTELSNGI
jgi:hypothetical protein